MNNPVGLTPEWAKKPFSDFIVDHQLFSYTTILAMTGLCALHTNVKENPLALSFLVGPTVDKIGNLCGFSADKIHRTFFLTNETLLNLLDGENRNQFPALRAYAVIQRWGALEDFMRSYLATWIEKEPSARQLQDVKDFNARFDNESDVDEDERYFYIVDRLESKTKARYKKGISRYETILELFGLAGQVDERTSRYLLEMQQLRHVLVHRTSIVDRRLVDTCPWLGLKVGEKVFIDEKSYALYHYSLGDYLVTLLKRVNRFFGEPIDPPEIWDFYDPTRYDTACSNDTE